MSLEKALALQSRTIENRLKNKKPAYRLEFFNQLKQRQGSATGFTVKSLKDEFYNSGVLVYTFATITRIKDNRIMSVYNKSVGKKFTDIPAPKNNK